MIPPRGQGSLASTRPAEGGERASSVAHTSAASWELPQHAMTTTTRRISDSEWEKHRAEIERLYCDENRTQKEVQHLMQIKHDFYASKWQYESHFKLWKLKKNHSASTWRTLDSLMRKGELSSTVKYHGREISDKKVRKARSRYRHEQSTKSLDAPALGFMSAKPEVPRAMLSSRIPTPSIQTLHAFQPYHSFEQILATTLEYPVTLGSNWADYDYLEERGNSFVEPTVSSLQYFADQTPSPLAIDPVESLAIDSVRHHGTTEMRAMLPFSSMCSQQDNDLTNGHPSCHTQAIVASLSDCARLHTLIYALSNNMITQLGFESLGQLWLQLKEQRAPGLAEQLDHFLSTICSQDLKWKLIQGAIEAGDARHVKNLIRGWGINARHVLCSGRERQIFSAIELASGLMHGEIIGILLQEGADVDETGPYTRTLSGTFCAGAVYWLLNSRKLQESLGHIQEVVEVRSATHPYGWLRPRPSDMLLTVHQLVHAGVCSVPPLHTDASFSTSEFAYNSWGSGRDHSWQLDDLKELYETVASTGLQWIFDGTILEIAKSQRVDSGRYDTASIIRKCAYAGDILRTVVAMHSPLAAQVMKACGAELVSPDEQCSCGREMAACFKMLTEVESRGTLGSAHAYRRSRQPIEHDKVLNVHVLNSVQRAQTDVETARFWRTALSRRKSSQTGEDQFLISAMMKGEAELVQTLLNVRQDRLLINRSMIRALCSSSGIPGLWNMVMSIDPVLTRSAVSWAVRRVDASVLDALTTWGLRLDDSDCTLRRRACESKNQLVLKKCLDLIHQDPLEGGLVVDLQENDDVVAPVLLNYTPRGARAARIRAIGDVLAFAIRAGRAQDIQKHLKHEVDFFTQIRWADAAGERPQSLLALLISACKPRGEDALRPVLRSCCKGLSIDRVISSSSSGSAAMTPLLLAVENGSLSLVRMMVVEFKADINLPAVHGRRRTPLQKAAEDGKYDIVSWLLDQGAAVNGKINQRGGATALQLAARQGYCGIMELLINRDADMDAARALIGGRTALEGAAEHGRVDAVKLLLDSGARGEGKDPFKRPLQLARRNGQVDTVALLLDYSRIRSPNTDGTGSEDLEVDTDLSETDDYLVNDYFDLCDDSESEPEPHKEGLTD